MYKVYKRPLSVCKIKSHAVKVELNRLPHKPTKLTSALAMRKVDLQQYE